MQKNLDLRQKKVIDADTAERLGNIVDMDIDLTTGKIRSVTISKNGFSRFINEAKEINVLWDEIVAMGISAVGGEPRRLRDRLHNPAGQKT